MKKITKNSLLLLSMLFMATIVIISCGKKKEEEPDTPDMESAQDNDYIQKEFDDVLSIAEDAMSSHDSQMDKNGSVSKISIADTSCATITLDTAYADTTLGVIGKITISFDGTCVGVDGKTRSGDIIIEYTGRYRTQGTKIITTFSNFFVNAVQVEGTKTVENIGNDVFTVTVTGAKISFTDGTSIDWESVRTRTWVGGQSTLFDIWDDVYDITGTASGTTRGGRAFDIEITKALKIKLACWLAWNFQPVSGTIEVTPEGFTTRSLDYGTGTCDKKAVLTVDGTEYDINLK